MWVCGCVLRFEAERSRTISQPQQRACWGGPQIRPNALGITLHGSGWSRPSGNASKFEGSIADCDGLLGLWCSLVRFAASGGQRQLCRSSCFRAPCRLASLRLCTEDRVPGASCYQRPRSLHFQHPGHDPDLLHGQPHDAALFLRHGVGKAHLRTGECFLSFTLRVCFAVFWENFLWQDRRLL